MNKGDLIRIAGLAIGVLLIASSAAAAQPVSGFATYQLSFTTPKGDHSVLVNETSGPSSRAGYSDLVLQIFGEGQNLTYSKLVNASDSLFPYLPALGTQSFDYSNGTEYSIQVNLTASGTTTVTFGGSHYTLEVSSISVSASSGGRSFMTNGTVETFPSTLVYSASIGNSTTGLAAVLQATDLPLVVSSPQMPASEFVGLGVGVGATALGGAFLIRHRDRKATAQKEKPLHWVD